MREAGLGRGRELVSSAGCRERIIAAASQRRAARERIYMEAKCKGREVQEQGAGQQ